MKEIWNFSPSIVKRQSWVGMKTGYRRETTFSEHPSQYVADPRVVVNRNYAGSNQALTDRLAFPGGHKLDRFPRTLLVNAEQDNMRASGDKFAAELVTSGVDAQHHVLQGTRHAFLNRPGLEAFTTTVSLIAAWTRGE
jgi:acetyl esterase/lipase